MLHPKQIYVHAYFYVMVYIHINTVDSIKVTHTFQNFGQL